MAQGHVLEAASATHAVDDPLAQRWAHEPLALLFAPSNWKLVAMFVASFGAYAGYWFYRNWIALRAITGRPSIWPVWRAGLAPLWVMSCFRLLGQCVGLQGRSRWLFRLSAVVFIALLLLTFSEKSRPFFLVLGWLPIAVVNTRLRRFKRAQGIPEWRRERFTLLSILWLVSGGLLFTLSALAALAIALIQLSR
ncbi:hypothetical protein [Xanthomonas pisi]|uniref:DUF4234 domain-containing protein n=1 Tax=Xanthomonas pisi TaxID=56457 RepID=A0A2S7CY81_9XANT|nr:hypothetical protein [Xanthomonas pisi]PPU66543.1 hypothetical protein XpiCFBP4643_18640 [Xanthomonas pisi]